MTKIRKDVGGIDIKLQKMGSWRREGMMRVGKQSEDWTIATRSGISKAAVDPWRPPQYLRSSNKPKSKGVAAGRRNAQTKVACANGAKYVL